MKVVVLGSDLRMQTLYHEFRQFVDTVLLDASSDLEEVGDFDVLVLPIRAVDELGNLKCGNQLLSCVDSFWEKASNAMIFAGSKDVFLSRFHHVIYYMEANEIKQRNAYLTAEGILYYMIDHTNRSIFQLQVDIIGKGLCGGAFGWLLERLGIAVRYVRREVQGEHEIGIADWKRKKAGDVVVVTAPVSIIDEEWMMKQTHHPLVIDIVSTAILNESYIRQLGFPYVKALGIPAVFAYESAGKILFEWIWGKIHEK